MRSEIIIYQAEDKAKVSCKTTDEAVSNHFVDVSKMVRRTLKIVLKRDLRLLRRASSQ